MSLSVHNTNLLVQFFVTGNGQRLARISHRLPAATADTLADTALRSVGRLDVLSSTPAAASVARLVSATSRPFRDGNR